MYETKITSHCLLVFLHINNKTQAQVSFACDSTSYCNLDLRSPIFDSGQIGVLTNLSYAKATLYSTYHDVKYLDDDSDCVFPADSCKPDISALNFDVYILRVLHLIIQAALFRL